MPPEVVAALRGDPAAAIGVLRVLAEEPGVRPSVRVAARLALRRLAPKPQRRRVRGAADDSATA